MNVTYLPNRGTKAATAVATSGTGNRWDGKNLDPSAKQLKIQGFLNYLEDHPSGCKWLLQPRFISHGFRPCARGPTSRSLVDLHTHHGYGMILQGSDWPPFNSQFTVASMKVGRIQVGIPSCLKLETIFKG